MSTQLAASATLILAAYLTACGSTDDTQVDTARAGMAGVPTGGGNGGAGLPDAFIASKDGNGGATTDSGSSKDGAPTDSASHVIDAAADMDAAEGAMGATEAVHFYGRWNLLPTAAITVNGGSHLAATFHGTGIAARFDVTTNMDTVPNLTWQIDGGSWQEADIADRLPLATGLAAGTHDVRLMVRGLNENQSRWTPPLVASVTFRNFEVAGGNVDPSPRPIKRKIEFLGDSITEGVLVHTSNEIPIDTWPWRNDARLDYACQTALAVDFEWRQVGFGRQGVTSGGNGGVPYAQDAFNFIYAGVPRDRWQADVVVINQGTNDGGASSQTFRPLYATLLQRIRAGYPNAQIVALRPFAGAHADDIKAEITSRIAGGDANVFYVDTTGWIDPAADTTDGIHPNPQGHMKVTTRLVAELKNHM